MLFAKDPKRASPILCQPTGGWARLTKGACYFFVKLSPSLLLHMPLEYLSIHTWHAFFLLGYQFNMISQLMKYSYTFLLHIVVVFAQHC